MNQIPNIEELKVEFTKWLTAETTFAYGVPDDKTIADWWVEKLHQHLQKARDQAYKDGARDVRDFTINELMKRAGLLRDDLNIFTFDQIKAKTDHSELDQDTPPGVHTTTYCNGEPCTCKPNK